MVTGDISDGMVGTHAGPVLVKSLTGSPFIPGFVLRHRRGYRYVVRQHPLDNLTGASLSITPATFPGVKVTISARDNNRNDNEWLFQRQLWNAE